MTSDAQVKPLLTNIGMLRYTAIIKFLAELRLIIIDVMEFDNKLRLWF